MTNRINIRTLGSFSFFQTIDFIKNDSKGSIIFSQKQEILIKERAYYIINHICKLHLTTIKAYYEAAKSILNLHYKLAIYLNERLIIISTNDLKNYNNIFINYANVSEISTNNNLINFHFKSGTILKTNITKSAYNNYIKRISIIKKHLNSNP